MSKFQSKFNQLIKTKNLTRYIKTVQYFPKFFDDNKITVGDIICENILPSPFMLTSDIIEKLKQGINRFSYNKYDLKKLSDKYWKYFNQLDSLSDEFSLTIIRCSSKEFFNLYGIKVMSNASMEEIGSNKSMFNEYIWINSQNEENFVYDDGFKNLLKHELGHVWTFVFGMLNSNFTDGQGYSNKEILLNPSEFNSYQKDVYLHLYNGKLKILQQDYNYILCKNNEQSANFEIPVHIDNIIEVLIADYLNEHLNENPTNYLNFIFDALNNSINLDKLTFMTYFKNNKKYSGYASIDAIKNPIRRLFLIFAFGTKEQIEYFKNACEDEFGKLEKNYGK